MKSSAFQFDFPGLHGRPARCGLELIELDDGRTVAICTELSDNPGVSVTNFAEELATIVCKGWRIDPAKLVWIEHYPADRCPACAGTGRRGGMICLACNGLATRRDAPTYDVVTFRTIVRGSQWMLSEPNWRPANADTWKELVLEPRC